jgi:uncharacterized membrane protein YgcG
MRRAGAFRFAAASVAFVALLAMPAIAGALSLPARESGRAVYDLAGVWSKDTIARVEGQIAAIRTRTGADVVVVSVPTGQTTVSTDQAKEDAISIMDTWGVGRRDVKDGLVLLFDLDTTRLHGQIYLFAGAGILADYLKEQQITSFVDSMRSMARGGDLDFSLEVGMNDINAAMVAGGNPTIRAERDRDGLLTSLFGGGAALLVAAFGFTWWRRGRDARMPLIDDSVLLPAPPDGMTPAMATMLTEGVGDGAFATALVDLAQRRTIAIADATDGGVTISVPAMAEPAKPWDDSGAGLAGGVTSARVEPILAPASRRPRPIGAAEVALGEAIRSEAASHYGRLTPTVLGSGVGAQLSSAFETNLSREATAAGFFLADPRAAAQTWFGLGGGVFIVGVIALVISLAGGLPDAVGGGQVVLALAGLTVVGLLVTFFSSVMAAQSAAGAQAKAMTLAYRNTLRHELESAGNVDGALEGAQRKLAWLDSPDSLLVWSVALGLRSEVANLLWRGTSSPDGGSDLGWINGFSVATFADAVSSSTSSGSSSSSSSFSDGGSGSFSSGGGGAGGSF